MNEHLSRTLEDTICAPATAPGRAALAVIRMSGPDAIGIASSCFSGKTSPADTMGGRILYGNITAEDGSTIDDVLLSVFRAPRSYTGEDSVEISCHGNPLVVQRIIERLIASGARTAEAGEFTRRAFENGKMDLTQVEAVSDIIHASSRAALRGARNQLDGRLSAAVGGLRDSFIEIASLLELELDFSEEDVEFVPRATLEKKIAAASDELAALIDSYRYGKVVHDGVHVAIVGPPNAGKSSLLNFFLKEKRAIVSHIPGTTRDLIREEMQYEGFLFILSDTAGLRDTDDPVEQEGVRRSREICREADVVVLLSQPGEDARPLEEEVHRLAGDVPVIRVRNKTDLEAAPEGRIGVSALTGEGMDALLSKIRETALEGWQFSEEGALVTSVRHRDALVRSRESLEAARTALRDGYSSEFVAQDIRQAAGLLAEILGEIKTDEVLDSIFDGYCIGK